MASDNPEEIESRELRLNFLKKHGIPHKPSCIAHDPVQGLLALAGGEGDIQVIGKAGVEVTISQPGALSVSQVFFAVNAGILYSLCEYDNSITKWDIKKCPPVQEKRFQLTSEEILIVSASKPDDKIVVAHLPVGSRWIYVGTEGGNLFLLDKDELQLSEYCVTYEKLSSRVRGRWESPGFIIGLEECPVDASIVMIIVSGGWLNLWNIRTNTCEAQFFPTAPDLIAVGAAWHYSGKQIVAGHSDGSICIWQVDNPTKPYRTYSSKDLYGCTTGASITRIFWFANANSKEGLIVFSGGILGSETTLTVLYSYSSKPQSTSLVAPSVINDFTPISFHPHKDKAQFPHAMALLCREELMVFEMQDCFAWKEIPVPTANNLATSLVTALHYLEECPVELIDTLRVLGEKLGNLKERYSWPLNGGTRESTIEHSMLITGHENGDVRFWNASGNNMELIYYFKSTPLFKPPAPSPRKSDQKSATLPQSPSKTQLSKSGSTPEKSKLRTMECDASKSVASNVCEMEIDDLVVVENTERQRDRELAISYLALCPYSRVLCVANRSGYILLHRLLSVVEEHHGTTRLSVGEQGGRPGRVLFNHNFNPKPGFCPFMIVDCRYNPIKIGFLPDCHLVFIQLLQSTKFLSLETKDLYADLPLSEIVSAKQSFFEDRNKRKGLMKTIAEMKDGLNVFVETLNSDKLTCFHQHKIGAGSCYKFFLGTRNGHLVCVPAVLDSSLNLSPSLANPETIAFDFWDATKKKYDSGPVLSIHFLEAPAPDKAGTEGLVVVVCSNQIRVSRLESLDRKKMKNSPSVRQFSHDPIRASFLIEFESLSFLACLLKSGAFDILELPQLTSVSEAEQLFSSWISCDTFALNKSGKGVYLPTPSSIQRIEVATERPHSSTGLYNDRELPEIHTNSSFFHRGRDLGTTRGDVHAVLTAQSERYKHRREQKQARLNKSGLDTMEKAKEGLDERGERLNKVAERAGNMSAMADTYLQTTRALAEKYK